MVDLITFQGTLSFLQSNGYIIMFLLMFFEGALITYIAAFAASLNIFNVYIVIVLAILGNSVGDIPYYLIGRYGRNTFFSRYFKKEKIQGDMLRRLEYGLKTHTGKSLAVIKLTPGFPGLGLILAGAVKVPFKKFFAYSFMIATISSLFFVFLGYYSGVTYTTLSKYLKLTEIVIPIFLIILVVLWFIISKIRKILVREIEKD